MAITSLDGIVAGMRPPEDILKVGATMEAVGVHHSFFYTSGRPGAAVAPSPGLSGAALTSYSGQIPWTNPVSGNSHLARFSASASVAGKLLLLDRLWHNSGIVQATTTAQTINSVAWPARSSDGTANGENVMVGLEVSTATTNAGAITNTTMSYTDSDGNAGNTATIASFPATAVAGTFVPFQLAAGDRGVRSIQTLTLGTSYAGGTMHLVAYRKIAELPLPVANAGAALDAISSGFPRLYDNSVLFLIWLPTATTAVSVNGQFVVTQG